MTASTTSHAVIALVILGWYVMGTLLVSSNKVLFDLLKVEIPLLSTFIHFSVTSFVLVAVRASCPDLIPKVSITRAEFIRAVLPVAITTALDVGLSNMAYSRLPISIMTVLKSSSVVFIYTVGVLFSIERFRWRTSLVCLVIATSIALAAPSQAQDEDTNESAFISGVIMVCVAVVSLSIRWVLIQSLTKRYTPLQLVYVIQPTSALVMLPFAAAFELNLKLYALLSSSSLWLPVLLVFGSAFIAMLLLICEYKIVHATSSLTLSIAGIGKEVLTLVLSLVLFGESFSTKQYIAISVSIVGIFVYALMRSRDTASNSGYLKHLEELGTARKIEEFELGPISPKASD
jgi:solute carrier family 35 protein C2